MLKYALLTGAVTIAAPALAQTMTPAPAASVPQAGQAGSPTTVVDPASPAAPSAQAQPVTGAEQQPAPADQATAREPAAAQPATTGNQVADVVNTDFPLFDKDGNGALSRQEFTAWMVALKTKSDPTTKPESAATQQWVGAAFAQADKDKNRSLSKSELTGFLSQGKS